MADIGVHADVDRIRSRLPGAFSPAIMLSLFGECGEPRRRVEVFISACEQKKRKKKKERERKMGAKPRN